MFVGGSEHDSFTMSVLPYVVGTIIALVSMIGNIVVCYAIYKNTKLRTSPTFLLIGGQCFSDFLLSICSLIGCLVCTEWFVFEVKGGHFLCSLRNVLLASSYGVSSLSMMVTAIERFVRLYYPHRSKLTLRQTGLLISAIYIVGLILAFLSYTGTIDGVYNGTVSKDEEYQVVTFRLSLYRNV